MTDRRADDGTLHMADCPYTAGAGWCSECGRGHGERDCCCDALRACTVRVLGEVREAVAAEAVNPWPVQNEFDVAYIAGHEDQMRDVLAAIDRLAQEAP